VHLGSRNLFTLLNLLRPDMFIDQSVFASMVEPNQYLNLAMRHVRHPASADNGDGSWRDIAAHALDTARSTTWGVQTLATDPRLTAWIDRLRSRDGLTDVDRIRCLRDLEELHTLSHVMNRTRRRDIGRFTIREPHTISVQFTPEQERFYRALIELRREMLLQEYDPIIVRLILDTLERQASSCLPALVPLLDRFLRTGRFSTADVTDDDEAQTESDSALPPHLAEQAHALRQLADTLPNHDPKLERLMEIAATTSDEAGPGKLLLFSYFLHTLGYLHDHLRNTGYRTANHHWQGRR
jgi:ATP-dependent helicase HepA